MNPAELRLEILKLCEAFGSAAETRNPIVIQAVGDVVKARVAELLPDSPIAETASDQDGVEAL